MLGSLFSIGLSVLGWFLKRSSANEDLQKQFQDLVLKLQSESLSWKGQRSNEQKQRDELNKPPV